MLIQIYTISLPGKYLLQRSPQTNLNLVLVPGPPDHPTLSTVEPARKMLLYLTSLLNLALLTPVTTHLTPLENPPMLAPEVKIPPLLPI